MDIYNVISVRQVEKRLPGSSSPDMKSDGMIIKYKHGQTIAVFLSWLLNESSIKLRNLKRQLLNTFVINMYLGVAIGSLSTSRLSVRASHAL